MNYKDKFYTKYYSTHVLPRKGTASREQFVQRARYYQKTWSKLLPGDKQAKIIDVGCGNGSLVWWLQQAGFANTEGIDFSLELIEVARTLGVNNITQADLMTFLAAKLDCYDVVILRDVLEHFPKDTIVSILEICHGSLRHNGILIIQVPNAETPFFGRIRYGDFTHEVAFGMSSLQQLLGVIGFKQARFYSTGPAVSGVRSLFRFLLWKPVEAFYRFLIYAETGRWNSIVTESIIAIAVKDDAEGHAL